MTIMGRAEINPKVMMGKPVIRGTRIPVELIHRKRPYLKMTEEDIQAAIRYAADTLAHEDTAKPRT